MKYKIGDRVTRQFNAHEILAALEYHKYALMAQTANVMDIKTGGKI